MIDLTRPHWVYRVFDADGVLLYVGLTWKPARRMTDWRKVAKAAGGVHVDGCDRIVRARGWCVKHYERVRRLGTVDLPPPAPRCEVMGCNRPAKIDDRCRLHFGCDEHTPVDWVNPLVCVCDEPDADPRRDFGMCQSCKRKPLALMAVAS